MSTILTCEEIPVICIVGPTASGKTALAQSLAEHYKGEIVSADSMQIYREMDIGTGKIPDGERSVPYWGLDMCDPGEPYAASLFQEYARARFSEIQKRGNLAILCGGTGLYIRAAIDDYQFPSGGQQNPVRDLYTRVLKEEGASRLWDLLNEKDPDSAVLIHPNNSRRVIRAFEMLEEGTTYAVVHENLTEIKQAVPAFFIGLEVEPKVLAERINNRVDTMVEQGLVNEVKTLLQKGFRQAITAKQAIGYKEIVAALDGEVSFEQAIDQIKTATRRYAKRQRTWFRADSRINWIDADSQDVSLLFKQAKSLLDTMTQEHE